MYRNSLWMVCPLAAIACLAQSTPLALPDGGAHVRLISIQVSDIPGAPFTATVNAEWVRTLANGTRITLVNHRLIARDSAGRVFQERRMLVPQNIQGPSVITETDITDPVGKQQYTCFPSRHICHLAPRTSFVTTQGLPTGAAADATSEPLGTQSIGGVETVGTRETTTIPVGEIGNDSPINVTREFWFAPKLGMNLITVRDDPRSGEQRFELSDIVLGEPDTKLFSPPEGDRIVDLRSASQSETPKPQN